MFLYESYCYQTIQEVADTIESNHFIGSGKYIVFANVQSNQSTIKIKVDNSGSRSVHSFVPASCSHLGFNNSFFGMDTPDSILLGSLMTSAIVAAWCIKILRRGF